MAMASQSQLSPILEEQENTTRYEPLESGRYMAVDRLIQFTDLYTDSAVKSSSVSVVPPSLRHRRLNNNNRTSFPFSFSPPPSPNIDDLEAGEVMMENRRMPLRLVIKRRFYQGVLAAFLVWFFLCKLTNYGVLVRLTWMINRQIFPKDLFENELTDSSTS